MKICRWCVKTLNRETLTLKQASEQRAAMIHSHLFHRNASLAASRNPAERQQGEWGLRNLDQFVEDIIASGFDRQVADPNDQSVEIKIIRATQKGLLLPGRQYAARPSNWKFAARYIKHLDGETCNVCRRSRNELNDLVLHAHHIVHRSYGGTNNRRNLVTLCYDCHQKQHPDIRISIHAGEPDGVYEAPSDIKDPENIESCAEAQAAAAPPEPSFPEYPVARGRSFNRDLALRVAGRESEVGQLPLRQQSPSSPHVTAQTSEQKRTNQLDPTPPIGQDATIIWIVIVIVALVLFALL